MTPTNTKTHSNKKLLHKTKLVTWLVDMMMQTPKF